MHDQYRLVADARQMQTTEVVEKRRIAIKKAHADGKYIESNLNRQGKPGPKHTAESKEKSRKSALASPHRRLVRSIREYTKKDGSIVRLDSLWEEILATRLDEINVSWVRPAPVRWVDDTGIYHNYFPDFYLNEYDVYLDPKNPYAIKSQKDKIRCLTTQLKNLIIITTSEDCKTFTPTIKDTKNDSS